MRIFLIWESTNPEELNSIVSNLKRQSNKIIYWMAWPHVEKYKPSETIFHNVLDATRGIPAKDINISEFPPPGKDLIEQLYRVESLILTMMNRRPGKLRTDERKHLYYNILQYWHGVLRKYKPDIIIHQNIPHDICSYLIYELAHLLNIKIIMFEDLSIPNRLLTYTNFWKGSDDLRKELQKNQDKNFSIKDLSSDLQEYYKLQTDPTRDATPISMKIEKNQFSGFNLFLRRLKRLKNSIKNSTTLNMIKQSINRRLKQNLKKEYNSVQIKPDFSKKFIYVPLQIQPECSTSPLGGIFVDQILMIETLSASLPPNWIIYAKEHPTQWFRRGLAFSDSRYQGYYKKIAKLKNVQLIPIKTNAYTLINKSQAVATITGTGGWEAILRGKPAIIFGYPWYRDCSEIFKLKDIESCKEALKKITNGFIVKQQRIINYLKCFDNAAVHGYFGSNLEKSSKLTKQESMNNIIQRILLEMKKQLISK